MCVKTCKIFKNFEASQPLPVTLVFATELIGSTTQPKVGCQCVR